MSFGPDFHALEGGRSVGRASLPAAGAGVAPGSPATTPLLDRPPLTPGSRLARRLLEGQGWTAVRATLDLVALALAVVATMRWPGEPVAVRDAPTLLGFPLLVLLILGFRGTYRRRLAPSALDDLARLAAGVSIGVMVLVLVQVYLQASAVELGVLVHVWGLSLITTAAAYLVATAVQRWARRSGIAGLRTLIVGAGQVGDRIVRRLQDSPEYGLRPIGFLDAQPPAHTARSLPVLGGPADLDWIAHLAAVDHVVLAFSASADSAFVPVVRRCEELDLGISVVPRLFDTLNDRTTYESLGGLPLLGLDVTDPRGWPFTVKHFLDRVLAGLALLLLSPLLVSVALAVRLSSPGPILFRQRRVGRDGRPFDLLKFRSMAAPPAVPEGFVPQAGSAPGGIEGDDRRTAVGRFLRRTSLDELPQLINVVRGEMSLVGPRPERPEYVERFRRDVERYGERHRVKAGITGWAQVHGLRGQTSIADRAEWDNFYIEHWSLWLDVKILLRTALTIFHSAE